MLWALASAPIMPSSNRDAQRSNACSDYFDKSHSTHVKKGSNSVATVIWLIRVFTMFKFDLDNLLAAERILNHPNPTSFSD